MAERLFGLETEYAFSALGRAAHGLTRGRRSPDSWSCAGEPAPSSRQRFQRGLPAKRQPAVSRLRRASRVGNSRVGQSLGCLPLRVGRRSDPRHDCRSIGRRGKGRGAGRPYPRQRAAIVPPRTAPGAVMRAMGTASHPAALPDDLIPHLVSRVIYTGAGGFDNRSPGIEFMISPRVAHLAQVISGSSTSARGIFHTKDESLSSNGYHRLHVLCGESVCSQTALWLKTAITTLVVALAEAGLRPCRAIALAGPVGGHAAVCRRSTCTARVLSADRPDVDRDRHAAAYPPAD